MSRSTEMLALALVSHLRPQLPHVLQPHLQHVSSLAYSYTPVFPIERTPVTSEPTKGRDRMSLSASQQVTGYRTSSRKVPERKKSTHISSMYTTLVTISKPKHTYTQPQPGRVWTFSIQYPDLSTQHPPPAACLHSSESTSQPSSLGPLHASSHVWPSARSTARVPTTFALPKSAHFRIRVLSSVSPSPGRDWDSAATYVYPAASVPAAYKCGHPGMPYYKFTTIHLYLSRKQHILLRLHEMSHHSVTLCLRCACT